MPSQRAPLKPSSCAADQQTTTAIVAGSTITSRESHEVRHMATARQARSGWPRCRNEQASPTHSNAALTEEERELRLRHGLDLKQIGYRRQIRSSFRGLARQEYAEDEESCFRASGESVFEMAAIEERLLAAPEPVEADALSKLGAQYSALYRTEDFIEGRRAEAEGGPPKYQGK